MDENTLLEIIKSLKNQISEIKGTMREQYRKEIEKIEEDHENEKILIEEKSQLEIGECRETITRQQKDIEQLERDKKAKDIKIDEIESKLIESEGKLQEKAQELTTKTREYDSLQQRFDDKVQEIVELNGKIIKKDEEHLKYINDESIRLYDKGNYDKYNIDTNKMNDEQKNYVIETAKTSFKTYTDHFKRAEYIRLQLQNKFGGEWTVVLHPRNCGDCSFTYFDSCYIGFTMGEYYASIGKTNLGDGQIRLDDKGKYSKVDISDNKMNNDQKNYVIKTTENALNANKEHFKCAENIRLQLQSRFGGEWTVVLQPRNYGGCSFTYFDNCYIRFLMGEFCVSIGKTNLGDKQIRLIDKGDYSKVDIRENHMNDDQKNFAINITRKTLNTNKDHFQCAKYIQEQFDNKYGGIWCVILMAEGYGNSYLRFFDDSYICFVMGEFSVRIGKTHPK